jgi:hypothetical protein
MKTTPRLEAKALGLSRYLGTPCVNGHPGERFVRNNGCVKCSKVQKEIARSKKPKGKRGRPRKYPEFVGPVKPKRKVFNPKTVEERWIVRSKNKSRTAVARRELSIEHYKSLLVTHCPLLGIELTYAPFTGPTPQNYASLDKIDPTKGYVPGNVQILSFRANSLKADSSLEELELLVKNWKVLAAGVY